MFVDGQARTMHKLGTHAAGPTKILSSGESTFSLNIGGFPETVSSDHVTAAPDRLGDPQKHIQDLGVPHDILVPEMHQHKSKEIVWEAFVSHEVADDCTLLLWTRWRYLDGRRGRTSLGTTRVWEGWGADLEQPG